MCITSNILYFQGFLFYSLIFVFWHLPICVNVYWTWGLGSFYPFVISHWTNTESDRSLRLSGSSNSGFQSNLSIKRSSSSSSSSSSPFILFQILPSFIYFLHCCCYYCCCIFMVLCFMREKIYLFWKIYTLSYFLLLSKSDRTTYFK